MGTTVQYSTEARRLMVQFGKRLEAVRIATGYNTHREFAQELGIAPLRYGHYARGRTLPPIDVLILIGNITGKSLNFLLTGSEFGAKRK